jgi:hypothetical protein
MITWTPIAQLPDELKDGREVLLADERARKVGRWFVGTSCWFLSDGPNALILRAPGDGFEISTPTHFAEITPP